MKLEIDKRYLTRGGDQVTIVSKRHHLLTYPFLGAFDPSGGSWDISYTPNGKQFVNGDSEYDLVAEVIPFPAPAPKATKTVWVCMNTYGTVWTYREKPTLEQRRQYHIVDAQPITLTFNEDPNRS